MGEEVIGQVKRRKGGVEVEIVGGRQHASTIKSAVSMSLAGSMECRISPVLQINAAYHS